MFKAFFYAIGVFYLIYEFIWISSALEKCKKSMNFSKLGEENKGKRWEEYSEEYKSAIKSKLWLLILFIWPFIGLFTFQWIAFLLFIIFEMGIMSIILAPFRRLLYGRVIIGILNGLIVITFILFVIINSYHLKIDLYKLINP